MSEIWYKEYCPECNTVNWLCDSGDFNDLSKLDVEAIKCYKCNHIFWLGDESVYEDYKEISGWESIEDCYWELGKESSV